MQLTFRQRLARMVGLFSGGRDSSGPERPRRAKRKLRPELGELEERKLLYWTVALTATPDVLYPPNGKYVEVNITGTFKEFAIAGAGTAHARQVFEELPGPKQASYQVIDEYHQIYEAGPVKLHNQGHGVYAVSFPVYLQASRSTEFAAGRQYYITVGAEDTDEWNGQTLAVQVPISLTDRGPAPLKTNLAIQAKYNAHQAAAKAKAKANAGK